MRVIVTGSRDGIEQAVVWAALDEVFEECPRTEVLMVVHGGARGADRMAMAWVRDKRVGGELRIFHEIHVPQWRQNGVFVKSAGHARNKAMVDKGADRVLAFIHNDSAGTAGCIRAARKADIPVKIHRTNDLEESDG